MLYNIRTGWNNVTQRRSQDLVFLVTTLRSLETHDVPFVFTDRHAFLQLARFSSSLADLGSLGWKYWQQQDFRRDPDDPEKFERYEAEALIHRHLSVERIDGIACSTEPEQARIAAMIRNGEHELEVVCRTHWFF